MKKAILFFSITFLLVCCENIFKENKANCVIVGNITVTEDYSGDAKFLGEIKNIGDGKALFVKINFTMKDTNGNVIGTDFTYVNSTDLDPGQTSSFECWTDIAKVNIASWTYEITWQDKD